MLIQEQIEELIKKGFELDVISFEFDIPIEKLTDIKKGIDQKEQLAKRQNGRVIRTKNNLEMECLRKRYWRIYNKTSRVKSEETEKRKVYQSNDAYVESCILSMEKDAQDLENLSTEKLIKRVNLIVFKLKKLDDILLSTEQLDKIYELLINKVLKNIPKIDFTNPNKGIKAYRVKLINQIAQIIEREHENTDDVERLQKIGRYLSIEIEKEAPLVIGRIKRKISYKIMKIKEKKLMNVYNQDVPDYILESISGMLLGIIDVESVNNIIEEELRMRLLKSPNPITDSTKRQYKRGLINGIGKSIVEKTKKFQILNPQMLVEQLQFLLEGNYSQAISIVVDSLIVRKEFEQAKKIVELIKNDNTNTGLVLENSLNKKIRKAELSDIVLKGIHKDNMDLDEERRYYDLIKRGIEVGNIKLTDICLGENREGTKVITLADIWIREKIIE